MMDHICKSFTVPIILTIIQILPLTYPNGDGQYVEAVHPQFCKRPLHKLM